MTKKQLNEILHKYCGKDFQITLSNYTKENDFFNISFTDELSRTLFTTWSKKHGFLNCEGLANYQTLRKLLKLDEEVSNILLEELKEHYGLKQL